MAAALIDWLRSNSVDFLALVVALAAGCIAWRLDARAARQSDYDQVHTLADAWDAREYFVRMWRLEMITRESDFCSVDAFQPALKDKWAPQKNDSVRRLWDDALALDFGSLRSDMHSVYHFALRLDSWLTRHKSGQYRKKDVLLLARTCGLSVVEGLVNHQLFACRLLRLGASRDHYPRAYGLFDERYARLVDELLCVMQEDDPDQYALERLLRNRDHVRCYLGWLAGCPLAKMPGRCKSE